jgi:magnesium transporter
MTNEPRPEEEKDGETGAPVDAPVEDQRAPSHDPERIEQAQEEITSRLELGAFDIAASMLSELAPPDQAEIISDLEASSQATLLGQLSEDAVADILEHMEVDEANELSGLVDVQRMAAVLDRTEPDVAADVLRGIEWAEASQILARMENRRAVGSLLLYQDDDAGGLMSPEVVALRDTWPAPHAINVLRSSGLEAPSMRQLFVVDSDQRLVGRLELSELVFAPPGALVRDVMRTDVISVEPGTDQEEAARLAERYEIRSLPVVDPQGRLEGAIAFEDLYRVAEREATEDMYRMAGSIGEDRPDGPIMRSVRSRLPWLIANVGTVVAVAAVLSMFESTLDSLAILAVYMPMVMNQAGIAGTQTTTVIVRSLALGDVSTRDTLALLKREYGLAIINGFLVAAVLAGVVTLWRLDIYLGLVIFGAMMISYFVAATVGVVVPLAMKTFRIDPATASGVILTTFTDIAGGVSYLGLATVFLTLLRQ